MRCGVAYLAVWLGTVLLRQAVAYASGAYTTADGAARAVVHPVNPALAALSADLVIVSIGLWIARAAALVLKYRENERAATPARRYRYSGAPTNDERCCS